MAKSQTLTKRALCESCYESFPEDELTSLEGRRLCADCAARAQRVPDAVPAEPRSAIESPAASGANAAFLPALQDWILERAARRAWLPRLPLLFLLAYVCIRHLGNPDYQSILRPLNFGIHEFGHFVFAPFGEFLGIAGGSLLQCLVPLVAVGMFLRQGDLFAVAFSLGWFGTNLYDVATYVADARAMALPLVSPGGVPVIHDWNYLLGRLSLLPWDHTIASWLRWAGGISLVLSIFAGASILLLGILHAPRGGLAWLTAPTPGTRSGNHRS